MKRKINNSIYEIVEVEKVVLEDDTSENTYLGACSYRNEKIQILKDISVQKKRSTLIHELAHAFMFENGHTKDNFTLEEVCDLFGAYASNIISICNSYYKRIDIDEFVKEYINDDDLEVTNYQKFFEEIEEAVLTETIPMEFTLLEYINHLYNKYKVKGE